MRLEKRLSADDKRLSIDGGDNVKEYDVVIIGNGPSAIILSYFLSGHWPYYNGKPVDDPILKERLKYVSQSHSLVLQDLEWLSEGMYDSRTLNPVSILFDHLYHPNADLLTNDDSVIEWKYHPENEVRHLVLGLGQPGGSWHHMSNSQLTVSLAQWLELPEYSFKEWYQEHEGKLGNLPKVQHTYGVHPNRTNALYVGMYYMDYVNKMELTQSFVNNVKVTSVTPLGNGWKVEGVQFNNTTDPVPSELFTVISDNVALACGAFNTPRKLNIPGEHLPFVYHQFSDPEIFSSKQCAVLVVGCGLVALDAILNLMARKIPVIHVFRRSAKDPELILNQLSSAYADYLKLKPLISSKSQVNEYYTPFPQHRVSEILPNKEVIVEHVNKKSSFKVTVNKVIVHIGLLPDLTFIDNPEELREDPEKEFNIKTNPLDIDLFTYELRSRKGLYALGPLIGDNFVRFISGGALAITHGLFRDEYPDSGIEIESDSS